MANRMLKNIIEQLISPDIKKDIINFARAKNIIGSALIAIIVAPLYAFVYYQLGFSLAGLIILLLGCGIVVAACSLKVMALWLVREIIVCIIFLVLTWLGYSLGGITSPAAYWLILPPFLAIFYGSIFMGAVWICLCACVLICFYMLEVANIPLPVSPISNMLLLHAISLVGLVVTFACLAYVFVFSKNRVLQEVEIKNEQLLARKDAEYIAKKAADANKAKGEFLAAMSHEIRTPLNGVIAITGLLSGTALTKEQQEYVNIMQISSEALLAVINEILDLTKIEAGQTQLENKPFCLMDVINNAMKIVSPQAVNKDNKISMKIMDGMPNYFYGDARKLQQVLVNLLNNACKFTEHGKIEVVVDIQKQTPQYAMLVIEVIDNGVGMKKAICDQLFQPFYQGSSEIEHHYGGTGLGLVISKHMVELMGGQINVISQPHVGTKFTVLLTLKLANELDVITVSDSDNKTVLPLQKQTNKNARILLVEDNKINQLVAARILNKLGYNVEIANNGLEALRILENTSYSAILMDCQMPTMDGYEATKTIRQHANERIRNLPIIALTAHALTISQEKCSQAGMNAYISKPIDVKLLSDLLAKWIKE